MKPSEELLALRESCVALTDRIAVANAIHQLPIDAWAFVYRETPFYSVGSWVICTETTHLEVIEAIERAALAAQKVEAAA
jgi:hypothetical protein